MKTSVSAHARARVSCKLQFLASWKRSFMDEVFSVTTSILAVYLLFRLASFSKHLLKEDDEELFVLLTALSSAGCRRKLARIQGFVEETVRFILATQM